MGSEYTTARNSAAKPEIGKKTYLNLANIRSNHPNMVYLGTMCDL